MRPFGYPVTILNTLDPLGKFDRKADEVFLVGYSINSKAFRVFNTRTRKVEENLHINLLENKPNVAGSGPEWLFDIESLTKSMNCEPVTAGNQTNGDAGIETNIITGSQSTDNKDADEVPGKGDVDLSERNGREKEERASNKEDDQHVQDFRAELDNFLVQQKEGYANNTNRVSTINPYVSAAGQGFNNADDQERIDSSTQDINTAGPSINTTSENINTGSSNINTTSPIPNNLSMQSLEATGIFDYAYDDREEVGAEANINNLETTMNVSSIPTTRIHKDHPIEQIIGYLHSAPLTRRLSQQNLEELGLIEAMQEELLQFKHIKGLSLVDLLKARGYGTMGLKQSCLCFGLSSFMELLKDSDGCKECLFIMVLLKSRKMDTEEALYIKLCSSRRTEFDFVTVKTTSTQIETNKALNKDEEAEDVDVHLFQVTPKTSHLHAVKRIFRYLKGQPKLGLWYPRDSPFDLEAFSDIANSTTKAEYVAAANCYGQMRLSIRSGLPELKGLPQPASRLEADPDMVTINRTQSMATLNESFPQGTGSGSGPRSTMSTPKFAKTHNLVAFFEKPKESNGFEEIINFLNASSIQYALTVNPTIYTTCIEQFWTSVKIIMANLPPPDHAADLPDDEPVQPEPAPIIPDHAPAQPEGYVGDDDMEDEKEEGPDEDPEEEPIKQVLPEQNNMDGFAIYMNPQPAGNMNRWLIEDDDEELEEDGVDEEDDEELEEDGVGDGEEEEMEIDDEMDNSEVINPDEIEEGELPPPIPVDPEPEAKAATVGTGRLVPLTGHRLFTNTQVHGGSSSSAATGYNPEDLTPSHIRSDLNALHRRNCIRTTRGEVDRATWYYRQLRHWSLEVQRHLPPHLHYQEAPYVPPTAPVVPVIHDNPRDPYVAARDAASVPTTDDNDTAAREETSPSELQGLPPRDS
ncbi:hypothetical protein Tco_0268971 [Tanacetum coccineum]